MTEWGSPEEVVVEPVAVSPHSLPERVVVSLVLTGICLFAQLEAPPAVRVAMGEGEVEEMEEERAEGGTSHAEEFRGAGTAWGLWEGGWV